MPGPGGPRRPGYRPGAWLCGGLWLLCACPGRPRSDIERYLAAAESGEPGDCGRIEDPDLASECVAFAAWTVADRDGLPAAIALCTELPVGPWRDECFFGLADGSDADGSQLSALCDQAGVYRDNCRAHALGRQAQRVLAASAIGQEAVAFTQVEQLAIAIFGARTGPARARSIQRKALAARLEGGDLRLELCGAASHSLCAEGYAQAVLAAAGGPGGLGRVCAGPRDEASVRQAGLPGWQDDAAELATSAWSSLCAGGARPLGRAPAPRPAATPRPRSTARRPRRRRPPGRSRAHLGPVALLLAPLLTPLLLAPLLLAGGCGRPQVERDGPAHAYIAAAQTADPTACARIGDPDLRGECVVFAAHAQAEDDRIDDARATCASLVEGVWYDECWFNLADTIEATGDVAMEMCQLAGRFRSACLGHVISRDSRRILGELPVGEEARALEELRVASVRYVGQQMGMARARQNLRKGLAARFRNQDFDPAACGSAPADLCAGAYVELVSFAAAHDGRGEDGEPAARSGSWRTRQVCEGPRTLEAVAAQGFPVWVPAGEALAQEGWDELCGRQQQKPALGRVRGRGHHQGTDAPGQR